MNVKKGNRRGKGKKNAAQPEKDNKATDRKEIASKRKIWEKRKGPIGFPQCKTWVHRKEVERVDSG